MAFPRSLSLALLLALTPSPLLAQAIIQPLGVSDADALAEQVRRLGANSLDLDALLTAGELSIRLDDLTAAGAFFARAEKIDPRNARAKAGEGAILVRSERPGEALRYFAQAESMGLPAARFAADRGLAYDLLGDQPRAQRDYREALRVQESDELRRRYALSLGISGRQKEAISELDPLIRRNDRAAWRSRAFILAMSGDAAEASRIAQTMMPPGSAQGLKAFFAELPRLPATDRAFAVHFGEVHATPARLADARLAPVLAPLPPEPQPVQVAAVAPPPATDKKSKRKKDRLDRTLLAAATPVTVPVAVAPPAQPPAYQAPAYRPPVVTTSVADRPLTPAEQASLAAAGLRSASSLRSARVAPAPTPSTSLRPLTSAEQANLAAATIGARPARDERATELAAATALRARVSEPVRIAPTPVIPPQATVVAPAQATALARAPAVAAPGSAAVANSAPLKIAAAATGAPPLASALPPSITVAPVSSGGPVTASSIPPTAVIATSSPAAPAPGGMTLAASTPPVIATPAPVVEPGSAALVPSTIALTPGAAPTGGAAEPVAPTLASAAPETSTPAPTNSPAPPRAVSAGIPALPTTVRHNAPASALLTPPRVPASRPGRAGHAQADDILAKIVAGLSIPAAELDVKRLERAAPGRRAKAAADPSDVVDDVAFATSSLNSRKGKGRAAAEKKALADKKAAAAERAQADKEAAAEKKAARAEPERIWVQVAGGANESDLAKAWASAKAKAPGAFSGRQGYTTPLRATNRVLTGPFKTDAEARAYVNKLAKSGVSAFAFTSDPGQKISKLDAQ